MTTTGVAKGVFPINTGKVLIGSMYLPRRTQYATEAELFWQGVLLGSRSVKPSVSTSVRLFSARLRNVMRVFFNLFPRG